MNVNIPPSVRFYLAERDSWLLRLAPIYTSICIYMYISLSLSLHCLQINDLAWFARLGLGLVDVVQGIFLIIYSFKKLAEA